MPHLADWATDLGNTTHIANGNPLLGLSTWLSGLARGLHPFPEAPGERTVGVAEEVCHGPDM